jgi:hypothetical protein
MPMDLMHEHQLLHSFETAFSKLLYFPWRHVTRVAVAARCQEPQGQIADSDNLWREKGASCIRSH